MRQQPEYLEQVAVFQWAKLSLRKHPELQLLNSSQNGADLKTKFAGARAKASGMLSGIPDIHLPISRQGFNSLYIEMKSAKGRLTDSQIGVIELLRKYGNRVEVCYSAIEACEVLKEYLAK